MAMISLAVTVLLLLLEPSAFAEQLADSAVYGVWGPDQTIEIDRPCFVPRGESLVIKPGTILLFKIEDAFEVYGGFEATGTASNPIILVPCPGWDGFDFRENGNDIRRLHFVVMRPDDPLAERVVLATASNLEIADCNFRGLRSCFDITEGRLWADRNVLKSVGLYSKTVRLQSLYDDLGPGMPSRNRLVDNLITADVMAGSTPIDPTLLNTCGLLVEGSYGTLFYGNAILANAPGEAVGARFRQRTQFGSTSQLQYCVIVAKSTNDSPKGVYQEYDGWLELIHCTIDVAREDPGNYHRTVGILAAPHASILVNSCTVRLDEGSRFFHTEMPSTINVEYTTRWSNGQFQMQFDPDVVPIYDPTEGRLDEWHDGGHNIVADPLFCESGEFLMWRSMADVEAFYSLRSGSPCIDAADTVYGYDPDQSLPDIGRYYFRSQSYVDGHPPIASVFEVGSAYPNPFNAVTVLPFRLKADGVVGATIYDVLGRKIEILPSRFYESGSHELRVGSNAMASGQYWVVFEVAGSRVASRRLVLIR